MVLFLCPPSVPLHSVYQVLCHSYNCQVSVCCACRQGLHLHFSCQVLNRSSHLLSVPSFQRLARCSVYLTSTSLRLSKNVAGPLGSSGVCVCVCSEVARPRALSGKKYKCTSRVKLEIATEYPRLQSHSKQQKLYRQKVQEEHTCLRVPSTPPASSRRAKVSLCYLGPLSQRDLSAQLRIERIVVISFMIH